MKRHTLLSLAGAMLCAAQMTAAPVDADSTAMLTPRTTDTEKALPSLQTILQQAQPTIKFGGYIVGKYSATDKDRQAAHSSFDLRFVRLYLNGYCFKDFYYRLQMEMNDAPGVDKGPRIVDAFIEWQPMDEARVKLGQFKRSFGFENPYNPLDVGLGSYSQATMKIASIGDRIGEHKSSGRDVGVQVQGDLLPAQDGHKYFHYQVGLFNGQGINHKDKDNHKDLIGGMWFSPLKDLAIGAFGWNGRYTSETTGMSVDRIRWGAGLKYESAWTVRGEYMHSVGGVADKPSAPHRADAWYATVGVPVMDKLKCYGRWDVYREAKKWDKAKTDWTLAANYTPIKNLIFQLNVTRTFDRNAARGSRRYNTIDLQLYARF